VYECHDIILNVFEMSICWKFHTLDTTQQILKISAYFGWCLHEPLVHRDRLYFFRVRFRIRVDERYDSGVVLFKCLVLCVRIRVEMKIVCLCSGIHEHGDEVIYDRHLLCVEFIIYDDQCILDGVYGEENFICVSTFQIFLNVFEIIFN